MDLKNRKVAQFRTNISPQIGPKPMNAFSAKDLKNWEFELTPVGVYVKARFAIPGNQSEEQECLIPYANIMMIKLEPAAKEEAKK